MILEILFPLFIILYWFSEGVTEGYTWAKPKRRNSNKLIHPNNKSNGLMDYHGWRVLEQIGIWGTVFTSFFYTLPFQTWFLTGLGSWLIGTAVYEMALNHVDKGTIYKPNTFKWHIWGYDIPWLVGKFIWVIFTVGVLILGYGIIR